MKKKKIEFNKQEFELTLEVENSNINFQHFLRINHPMEFNFFDSCRVLDSQEMAVCERGVKSEEDFTNQRNNTLIKNVLGTSDFKSLIVLKGYISETVYKMNDFQFDLIPYYDQSQLEFFIKSSLKVSNSINQPLNFNCPKYCEVCMFDDGPEELKCFQCQSGL